MRRNRLRTFDSGYVSHDRSYSDNPVARLVEPKLEALEKAWVTRRAKAGRTDACLRKFSWEEQA